jgi:V8-like Glu-specific endopeptidase
MMHRRTRADNRVSAVHAALSLSVFLALAVFVCPQGLHAWVKVGTEQASVFESPHPYPGAGSADVPVWQDVIHLPKASYIAVHFDKFDLAVGDRVVLTDPAGLYRHVYEGRGYMDRGGDFWGMSVTGDTLIVSLYAAGEGPAGYGYRIDRYAHGDPLADLPGRDEPEAICGSVDYQDAACYETSEPEAYAQGRAVVKLLKNGSSHCTGWLVSCENHIFTNEHCVSSQAELDQIEFQFMYQTPGCATGTAAYELQLQGGTFIRDNADLDYCLLTPNLDGNDPQAVYGYIRIDNRVPEIDERIYIVNHPSGQPKKLSLESTHAQDPSGYCEVYSTDEPPCAGGPGDIGYYCDTEGGSSGSPVLSASTNRAVALHHCADCPNRGVPITAICEDLEGVLPICSGCVSECFDDDGDGYGQPGTPLCTHSEEDCDDADPAVNPGTLEGPPGDPLCGDGTDNDCDGQVDLNDIDCVVCVDADGDGYGAQASAHCTFPEADCDDSSPNVNPGMTEGPYGDPTCEDTLDNDCDGAPDGGDVDCIEFYTEGLLPRDFTGGGTAMGWNADDQCWSHTLPFSFPYFADTYTSVYVCSNGFLDFTSDDSSYANSEAGLKARKMIALFWDDLKTNDVGDDIYIHQPSADSLAIRWDGKTYSGSNPVDAEVILHVSGIIRFNYGEGNTGLTPTVGISRGDGTFFYLSPHNGATALTLAESDRFIPVDLVCEDGDGDGYGAPASIVCTYAGEDCDDTDPDVNPGAAEVCDDSIENECYAGTHHISDGD